MDERIEDDTLVVVGMACRFAGSDGLAEYWARVRDGRTALGATDRWPDETHTGGFLDGHREFDARYFRISPNEARCMDPQQRLLMQSVQHAVDDSYLTADDLRELRCGVFVTGLPGDYRTVVAQSGEVAFGTHSFLGNAPSTLSGRISYFYDITGPSITLDSACSSSLTALHQALLNVRSGHCDAAIVGAASVFSTPEVLRFAEKSRMSSPRGACLPFTDAADGFVPAEGVASIVVMRHGEARARGLRSYGAVAATGTNHNGTTNGLMAPASRAQSELITGVHGGVDPARLAYVETHGTGTPLGDPIELDGLRGAVQQGCYLGAVKPLIGHTLVCSGLAGVIKVLLAFHHETVPPVVRTDDTVSYLDVSPFTVNQDPVPWPADRPLAAVSAFGFTGSNGHVVLRKLPSPAVPARDTGRALPFCLSAESPEGVVELAARYRAVAAALEDDRLWDLAQLLMHRPCHAHQRVVVAADRAELVDALDGLTADRDRLDRLDGDLRALVSHWQAGDVRRHLTPPAELARLVLPGYPFERREYWAVEEPEPEPSPAGGVSDRLCADLSALLGHTDGSVTADSRIATLGLDSLTAVLLLAPYGDAVKAHDLFRFETVGDLSAALGRPAPRTRWREYGDGGRPVVLLPPLNADHRAWVQQIPALVRAGRTVYVPEYPGHGYGPFDAATFSFERLADEIAEFVPERADLVGWSLGACVAALTALRHPELVRSLTLMSCAPRYGEDVFERTLDLRHELRAHSGLLEAIFDEGGDPAAQLSAAAPMEVLRDYYEELSTFDIVGRLPDITAPCLVLRGKEDCVVSAEATALLARIPGTRVQEFENHGHYLPLTAGWAVNETLAGFLASTGE